MTARTTVYSADAWSFNFAGLQIETGKGTDEFLKIEQQDDNVTAQVGIDGETVFSVLPQGLVKISLTLLQVSKGNGVLSAYHNASIKAGGLPAVLGIEDRNGTSRVVSPSAMIIRFPDETAAKEAGVVVWEFLVAASERFVGNH
jgi:hypothetical protein